MASHELRPALLSYYAREGMWGHVEYETRKGLAYDSSNPEMKWWQALASGISATECKLTAKQGAAIREMTALKDIRGMELASIVALIYFHSTVEYVDHAEVESLESQSVSAEHRANATSLIPAAQFHFYVAIHSRDSSERSARLSHSRELIRGVFQRQNDFGFQTAQHAARTLLAWINMADGPSHLCQDERHNTYQLLDPSLMPVGMTPALELEGLMARARYFDLIDEHDAAFDALNLAVAKYSWIPALCEKVRMLVALQDWDQARDTIHRITSLDEKGCLGLRMNALFLLSTAQSKQALVLETIGHLEKAMIEYEQHNSRFYFEISRVLVRLSGRRKPIVQAIMRLVARALQLTSGDTTFMTELANQQSMLGDYKSALETYRTAAQNDESNILALYGMIHCQILCGDLDDAKQQLDVISSVSDSTGECVQLPFMRALLAWHQAGDATNHLHLLVETEETYNSLLAAECPEERKSTRTRQDYDFMMQMAKEYMRHLRLERRANVAGSTQSRESAVKRGIHLLEVVLLHIPGQVEAHLLIAQSHFVAEQYDVAKEKVEQALQLDSNSAEAFLLRARVALRQSKEQWALQSLEEALACDFQVRITPAYMLVRARLHLNCGECDAALELLQKALQLPGVRTKQAAVSEISTHDQADIYLACSEAYSALGQFAEARGILSEALELLRDTIEGVSVIIALSELAIACSDHDGGIRLLDSVGKDSEAYITAQIAKADLLLRLKRNKHLYVQCYIDMVVGDRSAAYYERLGGAYMRIQSPEAAIEAYTQAYQLRSDDTSLAEKIAKAHVSSHKYIRATECYVRALQTHPDCTRLRHYLAKLYMKLQNFETATKVLTYPFQPEASQPIADMILDVSSLVLLSEVLTRANVSAKGDTENAMEHNEQSISTALTRAHQLQSIILERLQSEINRSPDELQEQQRVLAKICFLLGRFFASAGALDQAKVHVKSALRLLPVDETMMLELAQLHIRQNDLDACEQQCSSIMRINPQSEGAALLLAEVLYQKQDYTRASFLLGQLLKINPNNYTALAKIITLSHHAGDVNQSLGYLRIAERVPRALSNPGLNFCRGLHYRYRNCIAEAIQHFNIARHDRTWGAKALIQMIEMYIYPDADVMMNPQDVNVNLGAVEKLLDELQSISQSDEQKRTCRLLRGYYFLASRTQSSAERAMQVFLDLMESDRSYLPSLVGMSLVFMFDDMVNKARSALKRMSKLPYKEEWAADFERGHLILADISIRRNKFDTAEDLCSRCLKYNLSCGKAWEMMGTIREKEAAYKDAANMYEKAWGLENKANAAIAYKLAFNYFKAKRHVEAIDVCTRTLQLYPEYPKIKEEILEKSIDLLRQ